MSSVLPGRHPDDDVLADLAAEVLPEPDARTVEAHVIGCPRCAELLADAERMRRLLIAEDPGPMPLDVLARIESALQAEASARSAGQVADPDQSRTGSRVATVPVQPSPRSPSGSAPGEDAWIDEPTPWDDPGSWNRAPGAPEHRPAAASPPGSSVPRGARTRPAGRPAATGRSRRDLRESTRPGIPARGRLLVGAAGVVLLAGLGGIAVLSGVGLGNDTSTASGMASMEEAAKSAAAGGDAGAIPFSSSGTAYTSKQFVAQVRRLVVSPVVAQGSEGSTTSRTTRAPAPTVSPLPSGTGREAGGTSAPVAPAPAVGGVAALREPKRLAECLSALGQAGATPVAVDFARYDGREAAVIVLPGRTDGYEAWAVDPTCGPDGDGLLTVQQIPPS